MKIGIHQTTKLANFSCMSCDSQFEVYSTISKILPKMEVCGNCHTFYTGKSSMNVKTGKIDIFNRREKKSKQKQSSQ